MKFTARLRARASAWYDAADKSLLTNLAFLAAIALSAVLLVGAVGASWWGSTFASAVEVNGASISVGEARSSSSDSDKKGQRSERVSQPARSQVNKETHSCSRSTTRQLTSAVNSPQT